MRAMVLCAGHGTRLGELTAEVPKPMLRVGDRPLLEHILCHLAHSGFDEIAINLHYRPEAVRDHFGDGRRWGLSITYFHEPELLGTAGGVKNAGSFLQEAAFFLVQYGDVLTDQDFGSMVSLHRDRQAVATILVHQREASNSIVCVDAEGRVTELLERPTEEERRRVHSPWVNSGICLCSPDILSRIPAGRPSDLPRDIFPLLVAERRLYAAFLTGYRCAIDSPGRLEEARTGLAEGRCRIST